MRKKSCAVKGFTLIELIIVVAILGLLAASLFVAIDPAKRLGDARDARRYSEVTSILNAILQYTVDNTTLPTAVASMTPGAYYEIGNGTTGVTTGNATQFGDCTELTTGETIYGKVDLFSALSDRYLATIPLDPLITNNASGTDYYIRKSTNNRILVGACTHYQTGSLEVQR